MRRARRSSMSAASRPGPARTASRPTRSCAASCRCSKGSPESVPVSIDTAKAEVARRALALGAGARQRRHRAACRPAARGRGRRRRRVPLPHAHARRAADDAAEPALRRRRLGGRGVPRGAARVRRRAGDSGGTDLPRPGHRLRQDGAAELRARPPSRRAPRARTSGADRLLAQELSRTRSWAIPTRRRARSARASRRPSPPTTAAHRSCVCTTCASTSRRLPCRTRSRGPMNTSSCADCASSATTASTSTRSATARTSSSTSISPSVSAAPPTGSRMPSTTATSHARCRSSPTRGATTCSEALATAIADELLRRFGAERVLVRVTKPGVRPGGLDGTAGVSVSKP